MALTIDQAPYEMAVVGQKLIFVLSSTQVAEDQFRYVCYITIAGDTIGPIYAVPNGSNKGIIDIAEIVKPYIYPRIAPYTVGESSILALGFSQAYSYKNEDPATDPTCRITAVNFYEGWVVAGVFTQDPDVDGPVLSTHYITGGTRQVTDGYRIEAGAATILTNRPTETDFRWWPVLEKYEGPASGATNPTCFRVREFDYGILSFISDDGTATGGGIAAYKIFCVVVDSSGVEHSSSVAVTADAGQLTHIGCFPGNFFSNTSALENPWDYSGFLYYKMWIANGVTPGDAQLSQTLFFVPADDYEIACQRFPTVELSWLNSGGTYDSFTFAKTNQKNYQYERKRFKKILGTYNAATFDFEAYDRGLTEIDIQSPQFIEVNSDWLSEQDFIYLQFLLRSKFIIMQIQNDLLWTGPMAVVIDQSDYLERRERNGKMYNMTLKIRIANDQWT